MRFSTYDPFHHLAVWFTGVVDKAGDRAAGGVDDHVLVEEHEVVALRMIISTPSQFGRVRVNSPHYSYNPPSSSSDTPAP